MEVSRHTSHHHHHYSSPKRYKEIKNQKQESLIFILVFNGVYVSTADAYDIYTSPLPSYVYGSPPPPPYAYSSQLKSRPPTSPYISSPSSLLKSPPPPYYYYTSPTTTITELVNGRTISNVANKAIIKTIKVDRDEIIDCYDIFKQPSLNHPSLHNHTIQMNPSMYPKNIKLGTLQVTQTWHKYETCPHGTIPIRRNIGKHRRPKLSHNKKPNTLQPNGLRDGHEYAVIKVRGNFLGAQAKINLWNPVLETPHEMSVSQIWVVAGDHDDVNTIEAGWEVNPTTYGDYQTRFFVEWTTDTYKHACVNVECPGFVHTSSYIALGCNFTEMSTFNGDQKDATFSIHKDQNSGNWWIQIQDVPVGYYPSSLFTQLSKTAVDVEFGGEITNRGYKGRHTTTQMGNGHFPSEGGFGISSFFNHVQVINENNEAKDPEDVETYVSNPNCYDLKVDKKHTNGYGFYYGGSGYNDNCQ